MRRRLPAKTLAVLTIFVFGLIRLPLEQGMEKELRDAHFRDSKLDLSMREKVGQAGFVAALGGFRSLVASVMYLQAHVAFEEYEWAKVESYYSIITGLQPRTQHYWDAAHWHMAYNAYGYYMRTAANTKDEWDAWRMKTKDAPYYLERGKEFLEEGLKFLPEDPEMYRLMGELQRQKFDDNCAAADWFLEGSKLPKARSYLMRGYLYTISQCKGREVEAYDALKAAYWDGNDSPTVILGYEEKEDYFLRQEIAGKTEQELLKGVADMQGESYLPLARLARFYADQPSPPEEKLVALYGRILKGPNAPEFYVKKFGIALSHVPGKEAQALDVLKGFLAKKIRNIYEDVEAAIKRLETL